MYFLEKEIKCNKNKEYFCDFYYKGERIRCKSKTSKAALLEKIKAKVEDVDFYTRFPHLLLEKNNLNFEEAYDDFLKKRNLQPVTYHKYKGVFNKYFSEFIGSKVKDLSQEDVYNWYNKISRLVIKGKLTAKRANEFVQNMRNFLHHLKMKDLLTVYIDPTELYNFKTSSKRSEKTENNYISLEEFELLKKLIMEFGDDEFKALTRRTLPPDYFCFILDLLFYTGARINEAIAIQVCDIKCFKRNGIEKYLVSINKQTEDNIFKLKYFLKNGDDYRDVFIKKEVYKSFEKILKKYKFKQDDFVFDFNKTGIPSNRKNFRFLLNKTLDILREQNKLPLSFPKVLTPHGFRYSNALYLKELGLSPEAVSKMQGHTLAVTLNIYARANKSEIDEVFGIFS